MRTLLASDMDDFVENTNDEHDELFYLINDPDIEVIDDEDELENKMKTKDGYLKTYPLDNVFNFTICKNCNDILVLNDNFRLKSITITLSKDINEPLDISKKYLLSVYLKDGDIDLFKTIISIKFIIGDSFANIYECKRYKSSVYYMNNFISNHYGSKYWGDQVYYSIEEVE